MASPAATEMHAALTALEEQLDGQIYPQQKALDDEPDDHRFKVEISAGLWRQIGQAISAGDKGE